MDFQLIVHNILFLFGGIVNVGVAVFVFLSTRKHLNSTFVTFSLSSLAVAVFQFSHLLGINAPDAGTSRSILMFNLADIFIAMFMAHWFLGFVGRDKQQKVALGIIYTTGCAIFLYALAFPRLFLADSVPKLYFPFYYEPGPLYYVMFFWFIAVSVYHFYQLIDAFRLEQDTFQKKRYKFVLIAMGYAYAFGTTAFLLVFDIPFNPALSALFGFYPLILVYSILQYEVFSIKIFAKRAFVYVAAILTIGFVMTTSNFLSDYFIGTVPTIPKWLTSVVVSVLLGTGSMYIWLKARASDIAKYEFITIVTHKFRTPLTRIRWAGEEIQTDLSPQKKELIGTILQSERQLLGLTNMLVQLSEADSSHFNYKEEVITLDTFFQQIKSEYEIRAKAKGITVGFEIPAAMVVLSNEEKLLFALQVILDNAFNYTPKGGSVSVRAYREEGKQRAVIAVTDTGIGMSKEHMQQIFTRFYRGDKARLIDTEGVGIGLFMVKSIIEKQRGRIWAKSPGEGQGSTFFVELPLK